VNGCPPCPLPELPRPHRFRRRPRWACVGCGAIWRAGHAGWSRAGWDWAVLLATTAPGGGTQPDSEAVAAWSAYDGAAHATTGLPVAEGQLVARAFIDGFTAGRRLSAPANE
jgi:hypothetical protein